MDLALPIPPMMQNLYQLKKQLMKTQMRVHSPDDILTDHLSRDSDDEGIKKTYTAPVVIMIPLLIKKFYNSMLIHIVNAAKHQLSLIHI